MSDTRLTLEQVARYPRPGMAAPRRLEFAPDHSRVTYLFSGAGTLEQQLWSLDLATGERRVLTDALGEPPAEGAYSLAEELRRERSRLRERGVTDYQWGRVGEDGPLLLLVPYAGALYLRHGDGPWVRLPDSEGALEPRLSPDGQCVAFVRDDELYLLELDGTTQARQLTSGAGAGITNGVAEYIAQEEMGRREGFWWSPDSQRLAFERADSRHIPIYPIVHQGRDTPTVEEHRYPFAGGPNARVQLGVVEVAAGEPSTHWCDLGPDEDIYLARVNWRPDGTLTAQIESRDQRALRLVAFDEGGRATPLIEEQGEPWLNLSDAHRFLKSGEILWSSERSGYRHLYLYGADGGEPRALTEGPWVVTALVALDEARRVAYFQATRESVLERQLYAVPLDGGPVERITREPGWHEAVVAPEAGLFLDHWSHTGASASITLRALPDGTPRTVLYEDRETTPDNLGLKPPELTHFATPDGTTLYAAIYWPTATKPGQRHPLIVAVYGGPHAQMVANRWDLTVDLRAQYLAQQGYVVLKLDNRGSANRGLAFEAAIAGDLGHVEVADQVAGVRWLAQRPQVDGSRVGTYGWSYGGYLTCLGLLRAPDAFRVGVAGAPVTHWDGYDTHYTERYLGRPQANPDGYERSAALSHAGALQGRLLLIHGMVDENVHFRHTARLVAALTAAGKAYDLLVFPEERHMPRDARGLEYQERRLAGYFQQHL